MTGEIAIEELDAAVEHCVREVLWEAGIEAPPVDAIEVARRLGCVVAAKQNASGRAERVRLPGCDAIAGELILLAPEDRPERRQWSVAHELGELTAQRVFARLGLEPLDLPSGARERAANRFATCLLLPQRWFLPDSRDCDWDLSRLKQSYSSASYELIARRVIELHDAPIVVTVVDNGAQTWRRGNRWQPPPPCPAELETWQHAFETGQPTRRRVASGGIARVRAWPVHEPDWRREILLTEFEEE
jgi:Zn-dependent peptidase ImmA (M78 family)